MEDQRKEELTLAIYKHKIRWEVIIGKKNFTLDDKQIEVLKAMSLAGKSSIVWFGDFAISIPHISSMEKVIDKYQKEEVDSEGHKWILDVSKEEFETNSHKTLELKNA